MHAYDGKSKLQFPPPHTFWVLSPSELLCAKEKISDKAIPRVEGGYCSRALQASP